MAGPLAGKRRNTNVGFMLHAGVTRYEMVYKKGKTTMNFSMEKTLTLLKVTGARILPSTPSKDCLQ